MKIFLSLSLLTLATVNYAWAGIPSEDGVVAQIAKKFQKGNTPGPQYMKLTGLHKCVEYMATQGDNSVYNTILGYTFDPKGNGAYINVGIPGLHRSVEDYVLDYKNNVLLKEESYPELQRDIEYESVRISQNGEGIIEHSMECRINKCSAWSRAGEFPTVYLSDSAHPRSRGARVISYIVCERFERAL